MPLHSPVRPVFCALAALLLIGLPAIAAAQEDKPSSAETTAAPSPAAGGYADPGVCATCHEEVANALKKTTHGKTGIANWDGATSCQSCHGPGAAHAEEGDKAKIRNPKNLKAEEQSAICLSCHERGVQAQWRTGPHQGRGLSCLTCHAIHHEGEPPEKLLAKGSEFATCTSCHLKRKASLMRSAHMPMREGALTCSSCHNPHGSTGPSMLKQSSINENCYSCHAEKRAPVLWEHPPVRENCANCHDPHGSLHPRLLVAKQPRLCQQCHDETRHPTQPYSDASATTEFFPNVRMFDRGCMNCHSQIHGSNHPSGSRFNR